MKKLNKITIYLQVSVNTNNNIYSYFLVFVNGILEFYQSEKLNLKLDKGLFIKNIFKERIKQILIKELCI